MATTKKLVPSYNICFEAMTNSQHGASIGKECTYLDPTKRDITFCGVNSANMIDKIPNSMHYSNFDFGLFFLIEKQHNFVLICICLSNSHYSSLPVPVLSLDSFHFAQLYQ